MAVKNVLIPAPATVVPTTAANKFDAVVPTVTVSGIPDVVRINRDAAATTDWYAAKLVAAPAAAAQSRLRAQRADFACSSDRERPRVAKKIWIALARREAMSRRRSGRPLRTMRADCRERDKAARAKLPPPREGGMEAESWASRCGLRMGEVRVQLMGAC